MQQAKVAVVTLSQLAKSSILGRYKIKCDNVTLDPPSFIKSWDKVPTFVNILSKYKISWDIVPTDLLILYAARLRIKAFCAKIPVIKTVFEGASMSEARVLYCQSCGAMLNVEANRAYIFCQYCGAKNVIASEQMKTNINIGGIQITAKTEIENIIASAEYAVSIGQYSKANEMLVAAIMSGYDDYRIYITKAKIDLQLDHNRSLFESLRKLQQLEQRQNGNQAVTAAIREFMHYRGKNGVTALHISTFHEQMDMVVYCVEHGSDVNCIAGVNRVTPISIMFVPISSKLTGLDGTPFVHHKAAVKEIRRYLMSCGARDSFRFGY